MNRPIVAFHQDPYGEWVADLACGHAQHVRHRPPWTNHPWVVSEEGRQERIGQPLDCEPCDDGARETS